MLRKGLSKSEGLDMTGSKYLLAINQRCCSRHLLLVSRSLEIITSWSWSCQNSRSYMIIDHYPKLPHANTDVTINHALTIGRQNALHTYLLEFASFPYFWEDKWHTFLSE